MIKLYKDKLSNLRRDLHREATDQLQKDSLKGTRWLLLKNPAHFDKTKGEEERLREALELNEPLYTAYYLREDLSRVWLQPDKEKATAVLDSKIEKAKLSGINNLKIMAKTLSAYRSGILVYYDFPIYTGPLDGILQIENNGTS